MSVPFLGKDQRLHKYSAVVDPGFSKGWGGGGGEEHKIMEFIVLRTHFIESPKTTTWEVDKTSASPKRPFFVCFVPFFPFPPFFNRTTHEHCVISFPKHGQTCIFYAYLFISFLFLKTTPTSNPIHMHIHFPIGTRPHLALKCPHPPLDPPMFWGKFDSTKLIFKGTQNYYFLLEPFFP